MLTHDCDQLFSAKGSVFQPLRQLLMPDKVMPANFHSMLPGEADDLIGIFPRPNILRRLDVIPLYGVFRCQDVAFPRQDFGVLRILAERSDRDGGSDESAV